MTMLMLMFLMLVLAVYNIRIDFDENRIGLELKKPAPRSSRKVHSWFYKDLGFVFMRNNEADPFNFEGLKKLSTWPKCLMKKVFNVFFSLPAKSRFAKKGCQIFLSWIINFFEIIQFWFFFIQKTSLFFWQNLFFAKLKSFCDFFSQKRADGASKPTNVFVANFLSRLFEDWNNERRTFFRFSF